MSRPPALLWLQESSGENKSWDMIMDFAYHYLTRIQRWGNIKKCICVYYGLNFFNFFVGHALWTSYPENSEPSMYVPFLFKHPPNLFGDIYAIFNWILMQRYIERYILMYILMIFFIEYSMICYALPIRNQ